MMKTRNKILISCFLILNVQCLYAQEGLQTVIDSLAKAYLEKTGGVLQIGVFMNGKEIISSHGELKPGTGIRPDNNTIFEIGQITQVFTSSLFAMMSIHGDINPDEPIGKYLPVQVPDPVYQEIICEPVERMTYPKESGYGLNERLAINICRPLPSSTPQPILVCYLGTHTSGLPQRPYNMKKNLKNPYANYSKDDLYEFLKNYSLPAPVGYNFHYTDLDMTLLGHIMELQSGKSYASLLDSCILSPCGMDNTFITFPDRLKDKAIPGYNQKGKETPYWDFQIMAPAAGIKTNMSDMMKFLSANLRNSQSNLSDALNYTHNARIRFKSKVYGDTEAGLGWLIHKLPGDVQCVWQEGVTGGFASFIGFVEAGRYGVVILSNHGHSVRGAGKKILEEMAKSNH